MAIPEADHHGSRSRAAANPHQKATPTSRVPLLQLLKVTFVAGGIQFRWALQLSLLTPYVQELGIPHAWASVIWLCGPLSGLIVQPLVGLMSDRCTSRFGRRRPFIAAGAALISVSVLVIGHSADIGCLLGDRGQVRPGAIGTFVLGFWILDVATNMTQGPCRALLADLTGKDRQRTRVANAYFHYLWPLGTFLVLPLVHTADGTRSIPVAEEAHGHSSNEQEAFLWELFGTFRYFPSSVRIILSVTALNWIGWFPFLLFDTDWMSREIYGGLPDEGQNYNIGVRMVAFGLMLNSIFLGITSVLMEKLCRKWGAGFIWRISNMFMALCLLSKLVISYAAKHIGYIGHDLPPSGIVIASLIIFLALGVPLAITYSVPYALVSSQIESLGLGQGLSMGVLNLAIVIPQVVVSLGSGPWDQIFGGGISPAFAVGALAALTGGIIAILAIPRSTIRKPRAVV